MKIFAIVTVATICACVKLHAEKVALIAYCDGSAVKTKEQKMNFDLKKFKPCENVKFDLKVAKAPPLLPNIYYLIGKKPNSDKQYLYETILLSGNLRMIKELSVEELNRKLISISEDDYLESNLWYESMALSKYILKKGSVDFPVTHRKYMRFIKKFKLNLIP